MPNVDSGMAIVASLGINVLGNAGMPARMPGMGGMPGMLECLECLECQNARIRMYFVLPHLLRFSICAFAYCWIALTLPGYTEFTFYY